MAPVLRFDHRIVYPAACLAPAGSGTHRRRAGGRDHGIDDRARDWILAQPDEARVDPLNRIGATSAITNFPIYHPEVASTGWRLDTDFVEILLAEGAEIIQTDDVLSRNQSFSTRCNPTNRAAPVGQPAIAQITVE